MTKRKRNKTKVVFTPADREVIQAVKQAVCKVYEVTEDELMTNTSTTIAHLRFYCYWLLLHSTEIRDYAIAAAFGKTRTAVVHGVNEVSSKFKFYRDTTSQLRMIAAAANSYPNKKHEWCIQLNSTNN